MTSVLGRVTEEHVHSQPYHHLTTTEALAPDLYERLAARFPDVPAIVRGFGNEESIGRLAGNNLLIHVNGIHALAGDLPIDPAWRDFMAFHFSQAFYGQIVRHLGDGVRATYPDIEERLGKPLEELTVQPRRGPDAGADLLVNVQFAINTPVTQASQVRALHVDDPKKLFAGLFYMRAPEDDSVGGDLELCRWRERPQFQSPYVPGHQVVNTHIHDHQAEPADTVEYRANNLVFFVNSPYSVHGVTERQPTRHLRRYINFIVEARRPLYDFQQYRDDKTPWALTMGR